MSEETGYSMREAYHSFLCIHRIAGSHTARITSICPHSTPALNPNKAVKKCPSGIPAPLSAPAKPIPCISPKIKMSGTRRRCSSLPRIFSSEANNIDIAISGSIHEVSGLMRDAEVSPRDILCAKVNTVH